MRISSATFVEADNLCDYVPFISTVTAIAAIFQKCVCTFFPKIVPNNHYWKHIESKDIARCIVLLLPILGNLFAIVMDYLDYKDEKITRTEGVESFRAAQLACITLMTRLMGYNVTPEEMRPAETADEEKLWAASITNNCPRIEELLQRGVSPNFYHLGHIPLVAACAYGEVEGIELLLRSGAAPNRADRFGNTPLLAASTRGHLAIARLLRPHVNDVDVANPKGVTPLMGAAGMGHRDVVAYLIAEGADSRKRNGTGEDAVTIAMFPGDHAYLLPLLFSDDEDVDQRRYTAQIPSNNLFVPPTAFDNLTPLLYATIFGAVDSAIYLTQRSDVTLSDSEQNNALHYSMHEPRLVRALLDKCQEPEFINQKNGAQKTPLFMAVDSDAVETALLLLERGADPFVADSTGKTPLILACEKGLTGIVRSIQEKHGGRITPEVQQQMIAATRPERTPAAREPRQRPNLGLGQESLRTSLERLARSILNSDEADLPPRTGMEMIFGRLP